MKIHNVDKTLVGEMITRQRLKILSLGDVKSGKSCIIRRFCEGRFLQKYAPTIGVDYGIKQLGMKVHGDQMVEVDVDFWDFSGDKDYVKVREDFYQHADGIFIVFDIGSRESFRSIKNWLDEATKNGIDKQTVPLVLCASKADCYPRKITVDEVEKLSQASGLPYFETSSLTGSNIDKMTLFLCQEALNRRVETKTFSRHLRQDESF